ncbi:MAG: shikimate kinase [Flavobacteriaceae bacterium]
MGKYNHIIILVGVCGIGKKSVGEKLAKKLDVPFFDADMLFVSKDLPAGKLPQDENLKAWLTSVEELISAQADKKGCVISCSLLKKEDRVRLTANSDHPLDWVFMNDSYENVAQRAENSGARVRPASVLKSDFEALEIPKRALTIDMTNSEQEIVDTILKYLARKYG